MMYPSTRRGQPHLPPPPTRPVSHRFYRREFMCYLVVHKVPGGNSALAPRVTQIRSSPDRRVETKTIVNDSLKKKRENGRSHDVFRPRRRRRPARIRVQRPRGALLLLLPPLLFLLLRTETLAAVLRPARARPPHAGLGDRVHQGQGAKKEGCRASAANTPRIRSTHAHQRRR